MAAMQKDALATARRLFEADRQRPAESEVLDTLVRFGRGALGYAARSRIRVMLLRPGELYREASHALARLGIDVDAWPAPPAGLFVVEERALYLRSRSPMTVAHEFGHALDCALGGGVYRSGIDPQIRALFASAMASSRRTLRPASTSTSLNRYALTSRQTTTHRLAARRRVRDFGTPIRRCPVAQVLFECEFGERIRAAQGRLNLSRDAAASEHFTLPTNTRRIAALLAFPQRRFR